MSPQNSLQRNLTALNVELQVTAAILETAADAGGFHDKAGQLISAGYLTRRVAVLNEWQHRLTTLNDTGQFPASGLTADPGAFLP